MIKENIPVQENYLVVKKVKNKNFLFDAKNMLIFELAKDFDEDEYRKLVKTLNDVPITSEDSISKVVFNISNICNYRCAYCYANCGNYGRKDKFMTLSTLNLIVESLVSEGIKNIGVVELFGGEATLNSDLIEMIDIIYKAFNVDRFLITTNGSADKALVSELTRYPISFYVSIDGPKEINDILRGEGSYKRAMNFISYLNEYGFKYSVSTTYTKKHQLLGIEYKDLYEFAEINNFDISINTVISRDDDMAVDKRISKYELISEMERTLSILTNSEKSINLDPYIMRILKGLFLSIKSDKFCVDLQTSNSIHFDYDGGVYNCFKLWSDERFKLNSIKSSNPVLDLLNNKDNYKRCHDCWAKYLCELCVKDTFLGNESFPFLQHRCEKELRFDLALEMILEKVVSGEIEDIKNNFVNYLI